MMYNTQQRMKNHPHRESFINILDVIDETHEANFVVTGCRYDNWKLVSSQFSILVLDHAIYNRRALSLLVFSI